MSCSRINLNCYMLATIAVVAVFGLAQGVSAQGAPLEFTQTGDAVPGGTVMVAVATNDGSAIQSVAWSQTYGVDAVLSGADTSTVTAMLGDESAYKAHLFDVLEEPPIGPDQLPPNVPPPSEEFFGGLQNRFVVVGANPFALEEGGLVELHVMVTTDSGSYEAEYAVHTALRWKVTVAAGCASPRRTLSPRTAGNPTVEGSCTGCHGDTVASWAETGHAEIFKNTLNTNTHYGESCFACHTVGFDPDADNGGIDEASDYQAFLDSGLINSSDPTAYAQDAGGFPGYGAPHQHPVRELPRSAGLAPPTRRASAAGSRPTPAPPATASRSGTPDSSSGSSAKHADYEVAVEESQSGTCSKCHSGNGFLAWLPVLIGTTPGDIDDPVEVTWTEDEAHPQTCVTCHDPHAAGDVSGNDNNATVWISGDTPALLAGFTATDVGRGAICMTCHNTRRGLRNDSTWEATTDKDRAPHLGAQTDILMGENVYMMEVGERGYHSQLDDSCATCHMEATPPPADLAYNLGGTNHTFYASNDICADCHSVITADDIQGPTEMMLTEIHHQLNEAWEMVADGALAGGNTIDLDGDATIEDASEIMAVEFSETRGRQALIFTLSDSMEYGPYGVGNIDVVPPDGGDPYAIWTVAPDNVLKSGWNFLLIEADGSLGVHNPDFAEEVLETTEEALAEIVGGGGVGGSANAVACTSTYVYWTEIAARLNGSAGSVFRTDVVAKNNADAMANLTFYLHADSQLFQGPGAIDAGAQGVFEDIVDMIGADGNKGALEICSDRPLEVVARIYNVSDDGTFGQFLDGINFSGLDEGDTGRLYALRQMTGEFRTNISVTNTGMETATVEVTLFGTNASELTSYELTVGSGMVVQDLEPFRTRAGSPDLGWGYAFVEVMSGEGVITSASVVDSRTNDPTTVPMKH